MLDYVTIHGDPDGRTQRWDFSGATRANTDHGRLYASIEADGGDLVVSVYKDAARAALVAQGTLEGAATGAVALTAQNASGLTGTAVLSAAAPTVAIELDVFYACDEDLAQIQGELSGFLVSGNFAGQPGFKAATTNAKREFDSWLAARGLAGTRFDGLQPLADVCAFLALAVVYRNLSRRSDDVATAFALAHDAQARKRLAALRVNVAGVSTTPFASILARK
ncbi:MAG: hypothetical protein IT462_05785 [Planctomycetes bacterium]|nr:hypothetical protein [Planctomycetota bacterium]